MRLLVLKILQNVLYDIYQFTGASLISAALFTFAYFFLRRLGIRRTISLWLRKMKNDRRACRAFIMAFVVFMILYRTLLSRDIKGNPVHDVIGVWGLYDADGNLYIENIENFILFIPLSVIMLITYNERIKKRYGINIADRIWCVPIISFAGGFLCSFTIETIQLFMKIGLFQLNDIGFNTMGAIAGGIVYYIAYKIKRRKDRQK